MYLCSSLQKLRNLLFFFIITRKIQWVNKKCNFYYKNNCKKQLLWDERIKVYVYLKNVRSATVTFHVQLLTVVSYK